MVTPPAVRIKGATLGYRGHAPILKGVDLDVPAGSVVALVGPSGAGKTTLVKALAGLLHAKSGTIEVLGISRPARADRGTIGYIPQRLGLVAHASVLDNVLMGALHRMASWRSALRLPDRATLQEAHVVLRSVGLEEKADEPVKELSGGQQRRVAVARALLQRPQLLLADEFLGELDKETAAVVEDAVLQLAHEHGTTIILVEHHVQKAARMAERVYRVDGGGIIRLPNEVPGLSHTKVSVTR